MGVPGGADGFDVVSARRWLALAVGSLVLAGAFAILLVVGRMPPFDAWVTDPGFFKRCLVVHVVLSLVVWFHAFLGSLHALLGGPAGPRAARAAEAAWGLAVLGVALVAGAAGLSGAAPVLSNYVPAIDHPVFLLGLAAFGGGLTVHLVRRRVSAPSTAAHGFEVPPAARWGLHAAAIAFVVAMATFAVTALRLPAELPPEVHFELLFWGGGHVLQFASEAAMLAAWLLLLTSLLGRCPVGRRTAAACFALLVAPLAAAPVLAAGGPMGATYRIGFMRLMQWGIFPVVSVLLAACALAIARAARDRQLPAGWVRDARFLGFAVSAALTLLGFALGAMIRGSNTIVPAHYHAAIGAVTTAFMAVTYLLLEPLGLSIRSGLRRRASTIQPVLFGIGQTVFAVGFAVAGAHGMARKAYGAEQAARSLPETVGLFVMGIGGLVAVAGGLLFLWIVLSAGHELLVLHVKNRRFSWQRKAARSIPSRSC